MVLVSVVVTDEKEKGINAYMEKAEFRELMEHHDSLTYPINFKEGWDEAIKVVLGVHPSTFEAKPFPCPLRPPALKGVMDEAARLVDDYDGSEGSSSSSVEDTEVDPKEKATNSKAASVYYRFQL